MAYKNKSRRYYGYKKRGYKKMNRGITGNSASGLQLMKVSGDPLPTIAGIEQYQFYRLQQRFSSIGQVTVSFNNFSGINATTNLRLCYIKVWSQTSRNVIATVNAAVSLSRSTDLILDDRAPLNRFPAVGCYIPKWDRVQLIAATNFLFISSISDDPTSDYLVEIGIYLDRN